jgi:AcrR family transcriptional regulator
LRRALLDAAMQLIAEHGIHGFTLREVARQAGVSHAAPYHHFADKSALVEALVIENYGVFAATLREAYTHAEGSAIDKSIQVGVAYVRFAVEHPASFRLIFRPELRESGAGKTDDAPRVQSLEVEAAALNAFGVLLDVIQVCQAEGLFMLGDPHPIALTAWAAMHGLATLIIDGGLQKLPTFDASDPEKLALEVGQILGLGMILRSDSRGDQS